MASPAFTKDQPEAAKRFLTAYLRGQRDYWHAFVKKDTPQDDIFKILANHTPIKDNALLARMATHTIEPNGVMDLKELQNDADSFTRYGTVKQKVDVGTIVDSTFGQAAVDRLGKINGTTAG
ncbi:MAG: hypothetical protein JOZ39_12345 [Chloroflexi bacterium]|nr:hypothetical protein [Chloroflexota bacterium]